MREPGRTIIADLKSGKNVDRISIDGFPGYSLRAVITMPDAVRPEDVGCLTRWRNLYTRAFLTEFVATESRTKNWLESRVHPNTGHILFMVEDVAHEIVGYMGVGFINWERCYGEADAIVRGSRHIPGLMAAGLRTLLLWSRNHLGIHRIGVRVLSDNPALGFYKRIGFSETGRVPLRRVSRDDETAWIEDPSETFAARHLVYHELQWSLITQSNEVYDA